MLQESDAAGIGKTRLLEAAVEKAGELGMQVARARGGELERDISFGVVLQLFEARVAAAQKGERDDLLAGAAALSSTLFGGGLAAGGGATSVIHGLYWLVANIAESAPLLVVVDDAHWSDEPSLRFLVYLAQRLDELPVALIIAARSDHASLLSHLSSHRLTSRVAPAPLSVAAVAQLVRGGSFPEADDVFCQACFHASGGNPLLLHELTTALAAGGTRPVAASAAEVLETGPVSVARAISLRLRGLPEGATSFCRAAAILGDGAAVVNVAALAGIPEAQAVSLSGALVTADILGSDDPFTFAHPVVRSAIYGELAAGERRIAHRRAAILLRESAAPPEHVAAHILSAGPIGKPWTISVLRDSADAALARGAPASAARYLRRALDEPIGVEERTQLLTELGSAEAASGDPTAIEHLEEAASLAHDKIVHAGVLKILGRTLFSQGRHGQAGAVFKRAMDELGDGDATLRRELAAAYSAASFLDRSLEPLSNIQLTVTAVESPLLPGEPLVLAHEAFRSVAEVRPAMEARDLALRAWDGGRLLDYETSERAHHLPPEDVPESLSLGAEDVSAVLKMSVVEIRAAKISPAFPYPLKTSAIGAGQSEREEYLRREAASGAR